MDNAAGDAIAASPLNRIRPDVVRLFEGMQRSQMRELDFGFSRAELIAVDGVEPACNQILHSRHTLIGMISGEQEFDIAAQGAAAWRGLKQAGGMGFYPAGRQVTSRFLTKKMTTLAVFIDPEASRETLGVELADQRWQTRISAEDPFLSAIFLQLGGVMQGDHDTFAQLMSETLMTLLHLQVLERFANRAPPASKGKESLTRALDLIHSELPHSVPLSALVAASGLPKARFLSAFRVRTGTSPHQYILRERLERACVLLRTTRRSLDQVADEVGFANPGHLARMFRQGLGASPRAWRHKNSDL